MRTSNYAFGYERFVFYGFNGQEWYVASLALNERSCYLPNESCWMIPGVELYEEDR